MSSQAEPRALRIRGGKPLRGSVTTPVDLDIAQLALTLAALADGDSELLGLPERSQLDALSTALGALGVSITRAGERTIVHGVGLDGLRMPSGALHADRSWTALALIAGLLSAQRFGTRITTHASLALRSVEHIVGPLRARGANIAGRELHGSVTPPISVAPLVGNETLLPLECELPSSQPSAKLAVLISALFAAGSTLLSEPEVSADHLERMLVELGLPLRRVGSVIAFETQHWQPRRVPPIAGWHMPGCVTCAAYLSAAALLVPDSHIALGNVGINPARSGFFDALRLWGGNVRLLPRGDAAGREPVADVIVRHGRLRGGMLGSEVVQRARGELGALALLGSGASRGLQLFDWQADAEHINGLAGLLPRFGVAATVTDGVLRIDAKPTAGEAAAVDDTGTVDVGADAGLALSAIVLALGDAREHVVEADLAALLQGHPGFVEALQTLGADVSLI